MDPAGLDGDSGHGGESRPHPQWPVRTSDRRACRRESSCPVAQDRKVSQVCRYFQRGFCFHGDQCSYQHLPPPGHLQWDRRHSEPLVTLPGPHLGLTRRDSEPIYLPSGAVGLGCGMEPGLAGLASQNEELGGRSRKFLLPSSADGRHPSYSRESQPKSDPIRELVASLQSMDLEQREQASRDVVCGICMDKVWDKPEAKRIFAILPNCTHAHCLGCLRTWRRSREDFPLDVIKACPQCRVHSSYIIPHRLWVSKGPDKERLIRDFKARTSQIRCRFFMQRNGRCPFKSDCIYLHQLPEKAPPSDPPCSAPGSEVLGPTALLEEETFPDCTLAVAFWGLELLLDPNSSHHGFL